MPPKDQITELPLTMLMNAQQTAQKATELAQEAIKRCDGVFEVLTKSFRALDPIVARANEAHMLACIWREWERDRAKNRFETQFAHYRDKAFPQQANQAPLAAVEELTQRVSRMESMFTDLMDRLLGDQPITYHHNDVPVSDDNEDDEPGTEPDIELDINPDNPSPNHSII